MKNYTLSCLLLLGLAAGAGAAPGEWQAVERQIASGKAAEAYATLRAKERERAGDPEFDYWLGLAALEAGQPGRATLAFERVLARNPSHAAARLDMGRAYYALGNRERAREELNAAARLNPPPSAQATITRYLAMIDARDSRPQAFVTGYAELGIGRDSNVTVGPRQSNIFLPAFGTDFVLASSSREAADNYAQYAVGGEFLQPVGERGAIVGGADLRLRNYRRINEFDYTSADLRLGYQHAVGAGTLRTVAAHNDYRLDGDPYRRTSSLGVDWRRGLDETQEISLFGYGGALRHDSDWLKSNDINQWLLGAGWVKQLPGEARVMLVTSAFVGGEREIHERIDGNKRLGGARVGALHSPRDDLDLFAAVGLQYGRYDRTNAFYDDKRSDIQYDIQLGAAWRFAPAWSLRPTVSYTRNDSNLTIDDYRRYDVGVFIRRELR